MDEYRAQLETQLNELLSYVDKTAVPSPDTKYNVSIIAQYFYNIPHVTTKLRPTDHTFNPESTQYLESLGIIVAIPGFWLILTLLFFLVFYLCRCCDVNNNAGKPQKPSGLACCKCMLFLISLITMAVICVGLLGNIHAHQGIQQVQRSSGQLVDDLQQLKNLTQQLHYELETRMFGNIKRLQEKLIHPLVRNREALESLHNLLNHMKNNLTKSIEAVFRMHSQLNAHNGRDVGQPDGMGSDSYAEPVPSQPGLLAVPAIIRQIEAIRWPGTWGIFLALLFMCLQVQCGVCKHSRCLLIMFSVLGLFCLVVCYVLTSQNLGISVAGSDFCMNPRPFIYKEFSRLMNESLVVHYLDCFDHTRPVFSGYTQRIKVTLNSLNPEISQLSTICEKYCPEHEVTSMIRNIRSAKSNALENLSQVDVLSHCKELHQDYIQTMNFACKDVLEGFALMLVSSGATGILFTLLVLCASHTWINIKNKNKYQSIENNSCGGQEHLAEFNEETDPFIPTTSASSTVSSGVNIANKRHLRGDTYGSASRQRFCTPPQTPHFAAGATTRDEQMAFLTPPPSYDAVGVHQQHLIQQQHLHQQHLQQQMQQQQQHHHMMASAPQHEFSQRNQPHYVTDNDFLRATQATKF